MGIRQLSSASAVTGSKSNKFWNQSTYVGDFVQIASAVVTSGGTSTITFSGIPQTFTHLQIRSIARDSRTNAATNLNMQFNSDAGTNYTSHYLYGNSTTAIASASGASQTSALGMRTAGNSATSSCFGVGIIDILDYSNTNKYKTLRSLSGYDDNSSGEIWFTSGLWMSSIAINSITITPVTSPILQFSSFALYGVR
jgi:hypothetical protein